MFEHVHFDVSFLCKVISPWTGKEETLRLMEAARCGKVSWEAVAVLANRSNLAPALRAGLRSRKLWPYAPVELRAYLDEIYRFNERRNNYLRQQILEVVRLLNGARIIPLPFKGSAALATGLFADPAVRFMRDLDVLVPAGKLRRAVGAIEEAGRLGSEKYLTGPVSREDFYRADHFAPIDREGAKASVELHRRVVPDEWGALLDTEDVWRESALLGSSLFPGVSMAVMSPTHQVIHCFIHSELAHGNHRDWRLDLRQLHHFAHLCMRLRDTVDWDRVASLRGDRCAGCVLGAYLHAAGKLFGVETPLSSMPDGYAKRHLSAALFLAQGRFKGLRILKDVLARLSGCLSEQKLKACYPREAGTSAKWRRLRRLRVLFGRYSRLRPWKEMVGAMSRRYDSLG